MFLLGHPLLIVLLLIAAFLLIHFSMKFWDADKKINTRAAILVAMVLGVTAIASSVQWGKLSPDVEVGK